MQESGWGHCSVGNMVGVRIRVRAVLKYGECSAILESAQCQSCAGIGLRPRAC